MPEENNEQNKVNQPTFTNNPYVADKHLDIVQSNPQVPQQRPQYINPHNFQNSNQTGSVSRNQVTPQEVKAAIPTMPLNEYENLKDIKTTTPDDKHAVIKLVMYIVPIIGVFALVLRSFTNKDVLWHIRQSLVIQLLWFSVMIFLSILNAPIISGIILTLWKLFGYGVLLLAGIQAYNGGKYEVPVVYDIGKNFIEDK